LRKINLTGYDKPNNKGKVKTYNSIIIGAGHNGLVCAAYLARSGQSVLVLEASESPGGLAAGREFHPGFTASVAHSVGQFPKKIAGDLELSRHGLKTAPEPLQTTGLGPDGHHVTLQDGSVSGVSEKDSDAWAEYQKLMRRFARALSPFWLKTMPTAGKNSLGKLITAAHMGLNIRRLGKTDMREFMRITALPARDLADEYFDDDILKAMLCWDGILGSKLAPRSPNHAVLAMLYRMAGEHHGAHVIPSGGVPGLIAALQASATASGAEFRFGSAVDRIMVRGDKEGLRAHGVQLAGGEQIDADRVISATDPKRTFLELLGVENLEIGFTNRIKRLRCDGYVAKLHLALDGLPEFTGMEHPGGRIIVAPNMDRIEFAFDDAKYGECSRQPVMEIVIPSVHEPSLAPSGQHLLSAHVMYVPYRLNGGWNDEAREAMKARAIDTIAAYAPGIRSQIRHSELLTPLDLERQCRVTGGHWHHTEFALDQLLMIRPTYEAAQYKTPLPGLYLCSAGCHPGGGLMGGPGHNAAKEILR
jgi:phytoene dehydrogenase-like protein